MKAPDIKAAPPVLPFGEGPCLLFTPDAALRARLTTALTGRGHEVIALADPAEAGPRLEAERFAFLILDATAPGEAGLDLCRQARTQLRGSAYTVLVLTPDGAPEACSRALEAGADDYLPVPCDEALLELRLSVMEARIRQTRSLLRAEEHARLSEEHNREHTALLQALVDGIPETVALITPERDVLFINRAGCEKLDLEPQRLVGVKCYELRDLSRPCEDCPHDRVLLTGEPQTVRRYLPERGRHYEMRSIPVHDEDEIILIIEVLRDVTENRDMEDRLRDADKLEAIGRLAGGVAHNFNNMLTGIVGYADVLRRQLREPEHQRAVDAVLSCARRSQDLTDKLLAYASRGGARPLPVDIHAVVEAALEMVRPPKEKQIAVQVDLNAQAHRIKGDHDRLQAIVMELCMNACDAMPEGGTLHIETTDRAAPQQRCREETDDAPAQPYLQLTVRDTGVGMDAETRKRVFEPFFTTKEVGEGIGLGLAEAFGTVRQHGGSIRVQSAPGKGSAFHICLPVDTPEVNSTPVGDRDARDGLLLVIDDDPLVREMTAESLDLLGYEVRTEADAHAGLAYLRKHPGRVRAILLDMRMPQMSGEEAFCEIKALDPEMPVLLISGYSNVHSLHQLLSEPRVGYLRKPFRSDALQEELNALLSQPEGATEA
jgi:signal transduction histidine kinase